MSTFGGCNNGVQAWGNGVNNCGANNVGTGSGSQNYGQGSGSNHVSGGMWKVSNPGFAGCPMNVGPGAGAWNMGSASGSVNQFNEQANLSSGYKPPYC
ncbi:hypothetical protein SLEP1_g40053 [Rubroshorea leprosula]|uniref:Uncharacterized protein n=1 Tax=Rubroshorea leprosula TaxID=152421 RepID=A0AAV5L2P2_9ROSI|nr:hypothetical protein SLEP1_g40053 [Rubroshorea leprosula]